MDGTFLMGLNQRMTYRQVLNFSTESDTNNTATGHARLFILKFGCILDLNYFYCLFTYFKEEMMRLSPPKNLTYLIAIILGILGILLEYSVFDSGIFGEYSTEMIAVGFGLLALGSLFKDL